MAARDVALTIYSFWTSKGLTRPKALAFVGNAVGEFSLRDPIPVGDEGKAFGIFQWHWEPRGAAILKATNIDVRDPQTTIEQHCEAAYWELTHIERGAWKRIQAATDTESTVEAIVRYYERSANPTRDITRRTAFAEQWAAEIPA